MRQFFITSRPFSSFQLFDSPFPWAMIIMALVDLSHTAGLLLSDFKACQANLFRLMMVRLFLSEIVPEKIAETSGLRIMQIDYIARKKWSLY